MSKFEQEKRVKSGIRTGLVGLATNVFLLIIKLIAGLTAGSVSILVDAMNSLGDSASSLFTIGGFYVANKPADREHPYGHQRAEYISGLFIAITILIVGFQFLLQSINRILNPTSVYSSRLVLILLVISILMKVSLGFYYQNRSKQMSTQSNTVLALKKDSYNDALMTLVIIISYYIEIQFGWYIDGYVGAGVAIVILYSGFHSILDSFNDLLGTRPDVHLISKMQEVLDSFKIPIGYHDLIIHKYGPNKVFATVDIEIDSRLTLVKAHKIIDEIEQEFEKQFNIKLVGHLDPIVLDDEEQNQIYTLVKNVLKSYHSDFHFHDFRVKKFEDEKEIHFDVVVPNDVKENDQELHYKITSDIYREFNDYPIYIKFDRDYILDEVNKRKDEHPE